MNSTYEIRTAHESDAAAIADLIYSTSLACCFSVEQPCPDWYASTLKAEPLLKLLRQEKMIWLLAEEGGTVVGVLALLDDNHVKYFFVHPDHQRRGVGKRLWAFALAARMLPLSLSVRSSLFAVPVYECLGFTATEPPLVFKGMHYQTMEAQLAEIQRSLAAS